MFRKAKWCGSAALMFALLACGDDEKPRDDDKDAGNGGESDGASDDFKPLDYAKDEYWACKPGLDDDQCATIDLTLSEKQPGGTYVSVPVEHAKDPKADCFYVYPSTDENEVPGLSEDVSDLEPVLTRLRNQGARFGSLCRMFVPLYRQMTLGTYKEENGYAASEYFDHAYRDVEAAFDYYLEHDNDGRSFVLLGHSQGTHTLIRLVQDRIEKDDALRKKMAGALLLGAVGAIHVPEGKLVGGTFKKIPLCSGDDVAGCIVAFDSKAGGDDTERMPALPIPDGMERACVVPATLAGGMGNVLALSVFERESGMPLPDTITDPYVGFPQSTTAECGEDGFMALNEWADSETRAGVSPQIVNSVLMAGGAKNGLHSTDYNYAMGDLLRIVQAQIDAL